MVWRLIGLLLLVVVLFSYTPILVGSVDAVNAIPEKTPVSFWHLFFSDEKPVSLLSSVNGLVLVTYNSSSKLYVIRSISEDGEVLAETFSTMSIINTIVWRTRDKELLVITDDVEVDVYELPSLEESWNFVLGNKTFHIKELGIVDDQLVVVLAGIVNGDPRVKVLFFDENGDPLRVFVYNGYLLDTVFSGGKVCLGIGVEDGNETYALIYVIGSQGSELIGRVPILDDARGPLRISPSGEYVATVYRGNDKYVFMAASIKEGFVTIIIKHELDYKVPSSGNVLFWSPDSKTVAVMELTDTVPNRVKVFSITSISLVGDIGVFGSIKNVMFYKVGNATLIGIVEEIKGELTKDLLLIPLSSIEGYPMRIKGYVSSITWPNSGGIYVFSKKVLQRPVLTTITLSNNDSLMNKSYVLFLPSAPKKVLVRGNGDYPTIYLAIYIPYDQKHGYWDRVWLFKVGWRNTRVIKEVETNNKKKIIAYAPLLDAKSIKITKAIEEKTGNAYVKIKLSIEIIPAKTWILTYNPATGWSKKIMSGTLILMNGTLLDYRNIERARLVIRYNIKSASGPIILYDNEVNKKLAVVGVYIYKPRSMSIRLISFKETPTPTILFKDLIVFYEYPHEGLIEPLKQNPLTINISLEQSQETQKTTTKTTTTTQTIQETTTQKPLEKTTTTTTTTQKTTETTTTTQKTQPQQTSNYNTYIVIGIITIIAIAIILTLINKLKTKQ